MRALILAGCLLFTAGCSRQQQPAEQAQQPAGPVVTVDAATAATLRGTIAFQGQAPKPVRLDMAQDPACSYTAGEQWFSPVEVKDGKLAHVFVYVKQGLEGKRFAVPTEPVVIDQRACKYVPHVVGMMAGQKLRVLNSDSTSHNVHPAPKVNAGWNESQMPRGPAIERTFTQPEIMVPVKCNQHPWMKMYVNVAAHPFFAVSGTNGEFEIKGLPPGEYTVAAVHERLGEQTMQVTVGPKETKAAEFVFKP